VHAEAERLPAGGADRRAEGEQREQIIETEQIPAVEVEVEGEYRQ
jgi:hypothetical protein